MKNLVFIIVFATVAFTPIIAVRAEEKTATQQESKTASANHSIVDQIKAIAQALGIAWGGPTN